MKTAGLTYGGLFLGAFVWRAVADGGTPFLAPDVAWSWETLDLGKNLLLGVFTAGVVILLGMELTRRFVWAQELEVGFAKILGRLSWQDIFLLALSSSLAEELFFRGALVPTLGIGGAALVFALLHVGPTRVFWVWTAMALGIGLVFGVYFERNQSILAPLVAHFLINLVNLALIMVHTHWNPDWREPTDQEVFGDSFPGFTSKDDSPNHDKTDDKDKDSTDDE